MQLVCVSYFEMSFWNFRWMFCRLDNQFSKSEAKPKLYACSATKSPADSAGGLDVSSGWFRPSPAQKALIRTKLAGEPAPRLLFAYRGNSSLIWICACLWAPCQPLVLNARVLLSPGVRSISGHCRSSCCSPALTRFPWAGDKDSSSSVLSTLPIGFLPASMKAKDLWWILPSHTSHWLHPHLPTFLLKLLLC